MGFKRINLLAPCFLLSSSLFYTGTLFFAERQPVSRRNARNNLPFIFMHRILRAKLAQRERRRNGWVFFRCCTEAILVGSDRKELIGEVLQGGDGKIIVRNSNYLVGEYYLCSVVVCEENGIAGYGGRKTAQ